MNANLPSSLAFLDGGGDMGARMRAHDWNRHPIGQAHAWPGSLQTLVALMLHAEQPMCVAWGDDASMLYNDAYAALLADRHPAALGRPWPDTWSDTAVDLPALVDKVRDGQPASADRVRFRVQGDRQREEAYFSLSLTPVRDPAGRVEGVFCICSETTGQVAGGQLHAQEIERQRRLFARAPGFVTILAGPRHVFEFVNDTYVSVFGGRDFVGHPIREVFPELEGQGFYEWLDKVFATGERFVAHDVPIQIRRTAGAPVEQRYLDFIYEPVLDDDGRTTGIFCEGFDVTEAHTARLALVELNADLERQVAERAHERGMFWRLTSDLVGVANRQGYFEKVNPAWSHVLGWTEWELAHMPLMELVHPEDRAGTAQAFDSLLTGEPMVSIVNRYACKDGTWRWIAWTAVPEQGRFYCNGRDVTAEKDAQAALDDAQAALRHAQKMEAIGQLTGGLAHDFNNLLGGISASLQVLKTRLERGRTDGLDRYIHLGQDAVRRAAGLTHRLLAFSRRQTLDPKPIDVNRLVGDMEDLVRRSVGPQVEVTIRTEPDLWTTRIDEAQLENAILNLCVNARDAMLPDGGQLRIETSNAWLDEQEAHARELSPGQYLCVRVIDNGAGMSAETIARAFDPFYTTKPMGHGTGLGLSMVYGFVRQSGGQVKMRSEPGHGTAVCMYLPRFCGEVKVCAAAGRGTGPAVPAEGETVLVIEDEVTIRVLLTEVLEEAGYRVIGAEDGPAGLRILEDDRRIDLLVTDVGLPGGLNGRQVADAARTRRAELKVLFITGYAENAAVGDGQLDQGMEVITKPFEMAALTDKVRQMIEG